MRHRPSSDLLFDDDFDDDTHEKNTREDRNTKVQVAVAKYFFNFFFFLTKGKSKVMCFE